MILSKIPYEINKLSVFWGVSLRTRQCYIYSGGIPFYGTDVTQVARKKRSNFCELVFGIRKIKVLLANYRHL